MTTPDFKAYLEKPNHCPWCLSENITGTGHDHEDTYIFAGLQCENCGKLWSDVYILTAVYDPETGETH